jgi:predicted nucleic acid-binding protein
LGLADELPEGCDVALGSDAIIYLVEEHPKYLPVLLPVFQRAAAHSLWVHASEMNLLEVLIGPLKANLSDLADEYRQRLRGSFALHPMDYAVVERAADIRAMWNLRTPDAIIAATAIEAGSTHLITNDPPFRRVEGLEVLLIDKFI